MASNKIEVYKGNTATVECTVAGLESLSGYTATLTVRAELDSDTDTFSVTGSIVDLVCTFGITAAQNTISPGHYYYDVTITDGTNVYTVVQDKYIVVDSVKF